MLHDILEIKIIKYFQIKSKTATFYGVVLQDFNLGL